MGRPRKIKLEDIKQTDGKFMIDDVLGKTRNPYKEETLGEYKDGLQKFNKIDLQKECVKKGLMPHDSKLIMIERLSGQFRVNSGCIAARKVKPVILKESDSSKKILGRNQ